MLNLINLIKELKKSKFMVTDNLF